MKTRPGKGPTLRGGRLIRFCAFPVFLAASLLLPRPASGGERPADPTVRFKDIPGIVESIAGRVAQNQPASSLVVWAVDVGNHWETGAGSQLAQAVKAVFSAMAEKDRPQMAVAAFTGSGVEIVCKSSRDPDAISSALETLKVKDCGVTRDLLAGLRQIPGSFPPLEGNGRRHVVLLSFENVDCESDVENTLRMLIDRSVTLHVIGRGAYLSDSWWTIRLSEEPETADSLPKGAAGAGPHAPFRELPVGFIFAKELNDPPSGFGVWAWCRLASSTGGSYYSHYPGGDDGTTFCDYHHCPFCDGKHQACVVPYTDSYLKLLRPDLRSRAEFLGEAAKSPLWTAVKAGWDGAAQAGVVNTVHPGFNPAELPEPPKAGVNEKFNALLEKLTGQYPWTSRAKAAQGAANALGSAIAKVEKAVRQFASVKATAGEADLRAQAVLKTLEAELKAARFNLDQFQLFCLEVHAEEKGKIKPGPGERSGAPGRPDLAFTTMIMIDNVFFCHGSGPIRELKWLAGKDTKAMLADLCDVVDRNIADHARTPFELANRRIALALFRPIYIPLEPQVDNRGNRTRNRDREKEPDEKETKEPSRRPARGGGSTAGGGGAATSGR